MPTDLVKVDSTKVGAEDIVVHQLGVKVVDGQLEGGRSADAFEEEGLLLMMTVLIIWYRIGWCSWHVAMLCKDANKWFRYAVFFSIFLPRGDFSLHVAPLSAVPMVVVAVVVDGLVDEAGFSLNAAAGLPARVRGSYVCGVFAPYLFVHNNRTTNGAICGTKSEHPPSGQQFTPD